MTSEEKVEALKKLLGEHENEIEIFESDLSSENGESLAMGFSVGLEQIHQEFIEEVRKIIS